MMRPAALLPIVVLLAACCSADPEPDRPEPPARRVLFVLPDRSDASVPPGVDAHAVARVEVAADDATRMRGLMGRESLRPDHGMLFVYPFEETRTFWMKDTLIPLSIAFATTTGRIVDIQEMIPAGDVPEANIRRYASARPAVYGLEMEAGWFGKRGIRVGDRILFSPEVVSTTLR